MQNKIVYRLRQFLRGLNVRITEDEQALIKEVLSPKALELFNRMPADAQRHSLNVFYTLQAGTFQKIQFEVDPDLAVAALLHDVGKVATEEVGIKLSLWLRGPLVLLDIFVSEWMANFAEESPAPKSWLQRWKYIVYVHFEHPHIGAVWADQAECSPLACWLVEHHQADIQSVDVPDDEWKELLLALQWADGQN